MVDCAAKHLCGMTGCPLINPQHHCMQCGGPTHSAAFCGVLWSDRDTSTILIKKDVCSERAQGLWDSKSAIMCHFCVDSLKNGHLKPSAQERHRNSIQGSTSSHTRGVAPIIDIDGASPIDTVDLHSEDESPALKPVKLKSIWECEKMTKKKVGNLDGWSCGWCMTDFKPVHATRALAHVLKFPNKGVTLCKAKIPVQHYSRYAELHRRKTAKRDANTRIKDRISDGINKRQASCLHGSIDEAADVVDLSSDVIDVDATSGISSVTGSSSLPRSKKSRVSIMLSNHSLTYFLYVLVR